jgi:hypothetical protein
MAKPSLMVAEVYDAFLAARVPDATARKAAEAVAIYEDRLSGIERELAVLRWMVGTNVVLTLAVLGKLLHG